MQLNLLMLLFLDVENIHSKVVLIVDVLGKICSSYDFIDLNFLWESLGNHPGMREKMFICNFRNETKWL